MLNKKIILLDIVKYKQVITDTEKTLSDLAGVKVNVTTSLTYTEIHYEEILSVVMQEYNVSAEDFLGKTKNSYVCDARHMFYYLSRQYTSLPVTKIGEIANRDHTTIISGSNRMKDMIQVKDRLVMPKLSAILKKLMDEKVQN